MVLSKFVVVGAMMLLTIRLGYARLVAEPSSSDGFEYLSTLTCNGIILSAANTSTKVDSIYANTEPSLFHEVWMRARVKVLHVFKGTAPAEIDFSYRVTPPDAVMLDGPEHVDLKVGKRYRFFLRPGFEGKSYVNVHDGMIDDNFAVQTLSSGELDAASCLQPERVTTLARDYFKSKFPQRTLAGTRPTAHLAWPEDEKGALWSVIFWPQGTKRNAVNIAVRNDGSIDAKRSNWGDGG
jgi:hypothetical protein